MKIRLLCILLVGPLLMPAIIGAADSPTVMVTAYQVSPEVLMPRDIGTVTVTIKNSASDTSANIQRAYLFTPELEAISVSHDRVGLLGPGESVDLTFVFRAPHKEDIYLPEVWVDVSGSQGVRYPIPIRVDGSSVILALDIPSTIPWGSATEIELNVANARPNTINSVRIIPRADGIEFSPNEIFIGTMEPDATRTINFTLNPTSPGTKDISFGLTYKNGGNLHSENLVSSVDVGDSSDVRVIVVDAPASISKGIAASIVLDVVNVGSNDVTGVSVIPISDDVDFKPTEYYIGTLGSGEMFTIQFDLTPKEIKTSADISFKAIYKVGSTWYESGVKTLTIDTYSPQSSSSSPYPAIIGIMTIFVVIVGAYYLYMKRKRSER